MNDQTTEVGRARLREKFFPGGVPRLWCPPLTHYTRDGAIDRLRIQAHLRHLSRHVKGILVPGSTSDGWELSPGEIREVLGIALEEGQKLGFHVLVAALKANGPETSSTIRDTVAWLQSRSHSQGHWTDCRSGVPPPVCGFTVCSPRGGEKTQEEIGSALAAILEMGLPTALYQLPQVTQNEIGAELIASLAARFENFILFKDSSGTDRVALSGKLPGGVFKVRGGEGDYAGWLSIAGGAYDGFLLSSANCFAAELARIIEDICAGRLVPARELSARLTAVIGEVFEMVSDLRDGNPFANANKAIDHFFAWGSKAAGKPPPRLHAGSSLPVGLIRAAGESLSRHGLMPAKGYL